MEGWRKENCVIYVCITAAVVGLFYMSKSWHSLWPLMMLAFCNFPKS